MNGVFKLLIEKLPVKFVAAILIVVLAWFGFFTAVALLTNRSVDFFPPHIGTDKALVAEFQYLSSQNSAANRKGASTPSSINRNNNQSSHRFAFTSANEFFWHY